RQRNRRRNEPCCPCHSVFTSESPILPRLRLESVFRVQAIVSQKDFGFTLKLQKSVWTPPTASALLDGGVSEATVRAAYCDVPCQIRLDWFSPEHGIVDLKTCGSLKWFEGECRCE
ncbi:MAG: PD-(D/E)XK nuclease-like domain-containing protein, partial [Victivallales bacterium]|nr:PD-(D/E)XK nuclease-like domain-containing protein [Victivallales bacterium]